MTATENAILARLTRAGLTIDIATDDIEKVLETVHQSPAGTTPFDGAIQFIEHTASRVGDLIYLWNEYGQVWQPRPIPISSVKNQHRSAAREKAA